MTNHYKPKPIAPYVYKRLPITREPRMEPLTPRLRLCNARVEAIGFRVYDSDCYEEPEYEE